jgi:hypothetical protein
MRILAPPDEHVLSRCRPGTSVGGRCHPECILAAAVRTPPRDALHVFRPPDRSHRQQPTDRGEPGATKRTSWEREARTLGAGRAACGKPHQTAGYPGAASTFIHTSSRIVRSVTCVVGLRREKGSQLRQTAEAAPFSRLRIFQRGSHDQARPAARPPDPEQIGLVTPLLVSHACAPFYPELAAGAGVIQLSYALRNHPYITDQP